MLVPSLILMTLLAGVHPFKLSLKPPTNEPSHDFYPTQAVLLSPQIQPQLYPQPVAQQAFHQEQYKEFEEQRVEQLADTKGASQAPLRENSRPLEPTPFLQRQPAYQPMQFLQPQALAYLIVRPIAQQYQYLEPSRFRPVYSSPEPAYPAQQQLVAGTKGGEGLRDEPITQKQEQAVIEQQQAIEQQHEKPILAKGSGKFMKLKSSLEQLAASAKAKLTLGSSYQVVSEETLQSLPPAQHPIEQTREEPIVQQAKEEPIVQQEPITQERQPEPALVHALPVQQQLQQEQLKEATPVQSTEEQHREQTIEEARKEVKLAASSSKGEAPLREQTRLTGASNFEPLRSTAAKANLDLDRTKGRF